MKQFFDKYGTGSKEPYQALEIIIEKLFKIKDKVERGDGNIFSELSIASNMLDDFAEHAKKSEFKPRKYHNVPGYTPYGPHNSLDTFRFDDRIGYRQTGSHYFPMYPIYPFFADEIREMPRRDRSGYSDQPEAYRRNQSRPNEY